MKVSLGQIKPLKGDISANILLHKAFIESNPEADLVIFPELSLTGYEPGLADSLAMDMHDSSLNEFQALSDQHQQIICMGAPTRHPEGIRISLLIFQPHQARTIYSKQYLHVDEEPYFVPGPKVDGLIGKNKEIALAICYEISIQAHLDAAVKNGAKFYLASVAKSKDGMEQAYVRLSTIAQQHEMEVAIVNCVGPSDDFITVGGSAKWDSNGEMVECLGEKHFS